MDVIEVYDLGASYWRKSETATAAELGQSIPQPRWSPCSVIARSKDGSSYNVYMFGGWSMDGTVSFDEVWVLSIPSFQIVPSEFWVVYYSRARDPS